MYALLKSTPPFIASVFGLFSTIFSLILPWSCPYVLVDESDYQILLPVNFGLLEILSGDDAVLLEARFKPFFIAAAAAISFLIFSALISLISITLSLFCFIRFERLFFNGQNLMLVVALSFNLMAVGAYISATITHLGGGSYTNGIWLNTVIVLMGLFSLLVSLFADTELRRISRDLGNISTYRTKQYIRNRSRDEYIRNRGEYLSIEGG